jgi:hypothetical protein
MQYIGEIKLFANGFINAKILAKKMVTLYRYASPLLSKQVFKFASIWTRILFSFSIIMIGVYEVLNRFYPWLVI